MQTRFSFARTAAGSLGILVTGALAAAAVSLASAAAHAQPASDFVPVTDEMLQDPAPGDWLMWRRTLDGWGYSPLDQIDRDNVGDLRMVWTRALTEGRQQGTPLAYGGRPLHAQPRRRHPGHRRGHRRPRVGAPPGGSRRHRRVRLQHPLAEQTGTSPSTARPSSTPAPTTTSSPSTPRPAGWCGRRRCWTTGPIPPPRARCPSSPTARSSRAGAACPRAGPTPASSPPTTPTPARKLWRRRTIPAPGEPGDETWGGVPFEERRHVGAWMVPSYDPALNLLYIGTSVTSPAPKFLIGGADLRHLYHNSTLALDADTGEIVWYYQHLNDHWDLDHPFERLLVDTAVAPDASAVDWINPRVQPGETRRVVTGIPGKTGVVYTLDRETGEFLWATPTITQNVISAIDGASGAVTENPELVFTGVGQEVLTCPHASGGKDWEAGAYSPLTNTMYFPLRNVCARMMAAGPESTSIYAINWRPEIAPGTDQVGAVWAISAETGETAWVHEQRAATMSLVTTGGGLVFGGDVNGRFRAFDQETGEVLWEVNLGSSVSGFPITYAVDGRQYVAVSTGTPRFVNLTPELSPSQGNNLFVFALPERDSVP